MGKRGVKPRPIAERFWEKVDRSGDCWTWSASRNAQGYGRLGIPGDRVVLAHRLSWEIANGPIPNGMAVLHQCDNPPCVRPDHLFLGTQPDNMADMNAKGRAAPGSVRSSQGEAHGSAKLDAATVVLIRQRTDMSGREWARKLGMAQSTIWAIRNRKNWRLVD